MKWFVGSIDGDEYLNRENVVNMYERYYDIHFDGTHFEEHSPKISYVELTREVQTAIYDQKCKEIIIIGDIEEIEKTNSISAIVDKYKEKGIAFVEELYGNFSFVLIDKIKNKVFLIRDQLGVKPLFYCYHDGKILFSNNLFLLSSQFEGNVISRIYMKKFIKYDGMVNYEETPYRNIKRVLNGMYVAFSGDSISKTKFWSLYDVKGDVDDFAKAKERVKSKIIYSLNEKLKAKKKDEIGLAISGGTDSTILYSAMRNFLGINVKAFSNVFDANKSCDERIYMDKIKAMYADNSIEYLLCDNFGYLEDYPENFFYTTEPAVNAITKTFSENLFAKMKKDNIKVAIDGFYADHIFKGNIIYTLDSKTIKSLKEIFSYALAINRNVVNVFINEIIRAKKESCFIPQFDFEITREIPEIKHAKKYSNKDLLIQLQGVVARHYGDYDLAPRFGIECIHPYLDRHLIEYLYSQPGHYRFHRGTPKYILREAFMGILPNIILNRVNKTCHTEVGYSGIRRNWDVIFPALSKGIIVQEQIVDMTMEEWHKLLLKFRSGVWEQDKIFTYITLELWLDKIQNKYGSITFF